VVLPVQFEDVAEDEKFTDKGAFPDVGFAEAEQESAHVGAITVITLLYSLSFSEVSLITRPKSAFSQSV